MNTHCDQGANVGSVMDRRYFLFFVPSPSSVQQVGGDMITSPGWGGVLYRINDKLYLQAPTYFCPSNPQNTFSPSCLKNYANFNKVIVDTNESLTLIDQLGYQSNIPFIVNNGLDYLNLEVMGFGQHVQLTSPTIALSSKPLRRSPRLMTTQHRMKIPTMELSASKSTPPQRLETIVEIPMTSTVPTIDTIPLPKSVLQ